MIIRRLASLAPLVRTQRRTIEWWVSAASNQVEKDRVEEVGPDRAASEWLLRCNAKFRWNNNFQWVDYTYKDPVIGEHIEAIDATGSSLTSAGFEHFKGLKHVELLLLRRINLLDDSGIKKLNYLSDCLRYLEIVGCPGITDDGIKSLAQLKKLQVLKLFDLMGVKDIDECREFLRCQLPECNISVFKI